jgi:3',5'-cyclic AMP phosphodiesterase CpdA
MSGPRRVTRRRAIGEALALAAAGGVGSLGLAGCGGSGSGSTGLGSTLLSTWVDPGGDAQLQVGSGEPLLARVDLGQRAASAEVLATLAHVTDAHVLDSSSPARVTFLDRLGAPFESTFRPQETLTTQVLSGAAAAVRALRPTLVIQGGDLIDNDQNNELDHALRVLRGGVVDPGSGPHGYYGVQLASDPDPFYYRPDIDAPQHPGLLKAAVTRFVSPGLGATWCPVVGDHDGLVAGELVPTSLTESLALGDRALWDLPQEVAPPPGVQLTTGPGGSPDGPPEPLLVNQLLTEALQGPTVRVPPDPSRREMSFDEVVGRLRAAARSPAPSSALPGALNYVLDLGPQLRLIVLDLARREGGSGGLVVDGQETWLDQQLADARGRWVIVVTHQPLVSSEGGPALLSLLDQAPRVIATLSGHTHRNLIRPRPTDAGGYWQISTASLVDFPQQARALRVIETTGGGVAIQTWMLDHVFPGTLGTISRELSYLDAQGGRPQGFRGRRIDRNVTLYRRGVKS